MAVAGGYVAGVVAFTGISIWRLGWQTNLTWLATIYPSISSGLGSIINRSFAGLVDVLFGPRYFATLTTTTEWPVPPGLSLFEKGCSVLILIGFLFWCWRKRRDAKGLVEELVLLPLVYLLAAPFSWVNHFALAVLPLTYLWAKSREANLLRTGHALSQHAGPGDRTPHVHGSIFALASPYLIIVAIALWPAATCAIIWVGMRMYLRPWVFNPQPAVAV